MLAPSRLRLGGLSVAALVACATLSACGNRDPFSASAGGAGKTAATATATPSATQPSATTTNRGAPGDVQTPAPTASASQGPATRALPAMPTTPGDAPSPGGTTPGGFGVRHGTPPTTLAGRIAADKTAMLNVRTMVSVVEGCHSGHTSYLDCNTHKKLGSPAVLGVTIGKSRGQVQITASKNGFRMTGKSLSGAKFTVARGPRGDRFKCIPGPAPGACPASHTWSW